VSRDEVDVFTLHTGSDFCSYLPNLMEICEQLLKL